MLEVWVDIACSSFHGLVRAVAGYPKKRMLGKLPSLSPTKGSAPSAGQRRHEKHQCALIVYACSAVVFSLSFSAGAPRLLFPQLSACTTLSSVKTAGSRLQHLHQ